MTIEKKDNRKNIKIPMETHKILKEYCENNGLKIEWLINKLINENCNNKKKNK